VIFSLLTRTSHTRTTHYQYETGPRAITRSRGEQSGESALFIATQREAAGAGHDRPVRTENDENSRAQHQNVRDDSSEMPTSLNR
jgi:hypothetical protein